MERRVWRMGALVVGAAGLASMVVMASARPAPVAEDDLTVVKRAVAQSRAPEAAPPEAPRAAPEKALRSTGKEPTWLKVRVTDKTTGRRKVTVNMPIAVVRAIGDGPRIRFGCDEWRNAACGIKISEVLAALEAGQDLVEVDDERETVRVWVE